MEAVGWAGQAWGETTQRGSRTQQRARERGLRNLLYGSCRTAAGHCSAAAPIYRKIALRWLPQCAIVHLTSVRRCFTAAVAMLMLLPLGCAVPKETCFRAAAALLTLMQLGFAIFLETYFLTLAALLTFIAVKQPLFQGNELLGSNSS